MEIKVKYHNQNCKFNFISKGEWIDLRSSQTVELTGPYANTLNGGRNKRDVVFDYKLIPLGFAMELPKGYEAHVVPRSSAFKKWGIIPTNHRGVIDETYKGDDDWWFMPVYATRNTKIEKGDRICQFRIAEKMPNVEFETVEVLGNENRGGCGSTGSK